MRGLRDLRGVRQPLCSRYKLAGPHVEHGREAGYIVDFGSGLVFENAAAYTLILRATARVTQRLNWGRVLPSPVPATLRSARALDSPLTGSLTMAELGGEAPWPLLLPAERELLERLAAHNQSLGHHRF